MLPLAEIVSVADFHSCLLDFPYEVRPALPGGDDDLVVLVGRKKRTDAVSEICAHRGRVVAAFKVSDVGLGPENLGGRESLPPNVIAVFTTNNRLSDGRVVSLPLGVLAGKLAALDRARSRVELRDQLCYANFALNPYLYHRGPDETPHLRFRLARRMQDVGWANVDISYGPRTSPEELQRFYRELRRHRFVLSPPGHGMDCYRTWEALYLGAIPVVVRSAQMSAFAQLPILFTDDYTELSEDYLERQWRELSARRFDLARLRGSWYRQRFLESVKCLREPRFVCLWDGDRRSREAIRRTLDSTRTISMA